LGVRERGKSNEKKNGEIGWGEMFRLAKKQLQRMAGEDPHKWRNGVEEGLSHGKKKIL